MELDHITYAGPPLEEGTEIISALPDNLVALLRQINGFILFDGGLHVRGICTNPDWHSLSNIMVGPSALHMLYPKLKQTDIPFAQDCLADQFLLRDREVHKLESETGHLEDLGLSLPEFFDAVQANPVEFLGMQPLLRHEQEGGTLQPGQVLHAYPPFCTEEASKGVSLRAIPIHEAITYLSDFARQVSALAPGQTFNVRLVR